ncbi:enoyl-CoA hydratase/isomerase family protein [Thalassobacillus hwangdonensis]|uniref:Enoyl-CoA hydratase/isomerase family protein n=1 Tax=Thalassobacillus hwangdonensis TaxID=546108 RepID=A0ABW3L270_9BACI
MSGFEFISTSVNDQVGSIILNRPKVLNALNRKMVSEIVVAMETFDQNEDVRVILVTGEGRAFAAGADIDEMAEDGSIDFELLNQFAEWDRIALVKKPIICAVQGFALGGGFELVLACDMVLAAEDAEFGFPEVNIGVMPGAGGTQRLTKLLGRTQALQYLWTGDRITAKEAEAKGIINKLISPELLKDEAEKFAKRLSKQAPLSLRMIKESVNKAVDYSLYEGMQFERKNFYLLFSSEDQKEGMNAFIEKRRPKFKGK